MVVYSSNYLFHELSRSTLISLHQGYVFHSLCLRMWSMVNGTTRTKQVIILLTKVTWNFFPCMQLPVKLSMTLFTVLLL